METNKKIKSYGLTSLNGDYKKYLVGLLSTDYKCCLLYTSPRPRD